MSSISDRSAETDAILAATALLDKALALGIRVGTDGDEVITVAQSPVPLEVGRWLHAELCKHKREVIAAIEADAAARTEVQP
jgi:hypothetical protein